MKKIIPIGTMTDFQHSYACENTLKKISFYKNSQNSSENEEEEFYEMMERYCHLCEEQEKLDFDDMLVMCHKLLKEHRQELFRWQERFSYILVDEFQDINRCQYEIVKLLAQKSGNLFVVGDDDQAIYSFRGSDPSYMRQFLEDYPECKKVILEENYRSGTQIVSIAGKCIENNEFRFKKNIRAINKFEHKVQIKWFDTMRSEIEAIADQIMTIPAEVKNEKIAVLVRTNLRAEYIAELFFQKKIPCSVYEKRKCFYDNPWVHDILSVLRFAVDGQKRRDFLVFMNKPMRGIERSMLKTEEIKFEDLFRYKEIAKDVHVIRKCIEMIQGLNPYGAIKLVLNGMKYRKYLSELSDGDDKCAEEMREVVQELLERARNFESIPLFLEFVKSYTENHKKNMAERRKEERKTEDEVQILTYHTAKGLEFDHVFIPMLKQGIVPHGHMLTKEQMEEERRMFYVAITRAKCYLWLSGHGKEKNTTESIFLKELQTDAIST